MCLPQLVAKHLFCPMSGNQDSESGKFLLVESGILGFGIRNPTNDYNPVSTSIPVPSIPVPSIPLTRTGIRIHDCFEVLTWGDLIAKLKSVGLQLDQLKVASILLLKDRKSGGCQQPRDPNFYPIYAIFLRKGTPSVYLL